MYRQSRVAKPAGRQAYKLSAVPWTGGRTGRVLRLIFLLVAVLIVVDALVGDRGLLAALDARRQHDDLAAAIARQRAENARLSEEAHRLKDDPAAIEEIARRDLGLIRKGEKVFIVKDLASPAKP